ncbi:MAG: hypothetical protein NVSMB5_14970 [Candidatus Velthaea sp.]
MVCALTISPPTTPAAVPIKWLLNGPGLAALSQDPAASSLLANAAPFVIVGRAVHNVPASWNAVPVASFTSQRAIVAALESGSLPPGVRAILYDNERWQFTPQDEQIDPASYMHRVADLVHAHHLLFITAPAVNLVRTIRGARREPYVDYLELQIAASAARYADVYEIQAQGSERSVARYERFVRDAAAQARAANPRVVVLAGVSTNPSGQRVTSDDVSAAIAATRPYVDGYWLNIPKPSAYCPKCNDFRPDIGIDVIRRAAHL